MEKVINLNKLFSTADAEDVEFTCDGYDLKVSYVNWEGKAFTLLFPQMEYMVVTDDIDYKKYRGDCPHQVVNSELVESKNFDPEFCHYMLCFNAWSNIEIISLELQVVS